MTKVEELREDVLSWFSDPYDYAPVTEAVDSLISDAHAEGVAEGAEQMKAEIRDVAIGNHFSDTLVIPASVLAPTKESEK